MPFQDKSVSTEIMPEGQDVSATMLNSDNVDLTMPKTGDDHLCGKQHSESSASYIRPDQIRSSSRILRQQAIRERSGSLDRKNKEREGDRRAVQTLRMVARFRAEEKEGNAKCRR